jgi:hypothetical protein
MYTNAYVNGLDVPVWKYNKIDDKPLGYLNVKDFMNEDFKSLPNEIELVRTLIYNHHMGSTLISKYNREVINNTHVLFKINDFYICLISPYMLFNGIIEIASHVYQSAIVGMAQLPDEGNIQELIRCDAALRKIVDMTLTLLAHVRKIKAFHQVIFKNFTVKFKRYTDKHPYLKNNPEMLEEIMQVFKENWKPKFESDEMFTDNTWMGYQNVFIGLEKIQNCLDMFLNTYEYHANRKYPTIEMWMTVRDEFFVIAYRPDMFKKIVLDEKEVKIFQ